MNDDDDNKNAPLEDQLCRIAHAAQSVTYKLRPEAWALHSESERLHQESERLQHESQRLREKSAQMQEYGTKLDDLQKTSLLDRFCCALRHNDPSISILDLQRLKPILPTDFVEPIGNALQGNTHISSVILANNRTNLPIPEWTRQKATRLVQYVQTSSSIRHIDISIEDEMVVADFLNAIGSNPSIEQLTLSRDMRPVAIYDSMESGESSATQNVLPSTAFCDLMATTRSLKTLEFNLEVEEKATDAMVQAFSANQTWESLSIGSPMPRLLGIEPALRGITMSGTSALRALHLKCDRLVSGQAFNSLCSLLCTVQSL
jgi:hypothetical protein